MWNELMPATEHTSPQPIVACWSGGKDSALMLQRLLRDPSYRVVGLITMVTAGDRRISMHGVSHELLMEQAERLGLPLVTAEIPSFPANAVYETAFARAVDRFRSLGVQIVAFGDLFLADIRTYREQLCDRLGLTAVFPLWGEDTTRLGGTFLSQGFHAIICCVDAAKLPRDCIGTAYDAAFLTRLPAGVDPCGENGEFHTFVTSGPILSSPIDAHVAGVTESPGFWRAEWRLPPSKANVSPNQHRRTWTEPARESSHV
jgi:uncharacterized protein (TIGR00290 family)